MIGIFFVNLVFPIIGPGIWYMKPHIIKQFISEAPASDSAVATLHNGMLLILEPKEYGNLDAANGVEHVT